MNKPRETLSAGPLNGWSKHFLSVFILAMDIQP